MGAFHTGWYVLYTKFNTERKVVTTLKEKSVECFLPATKVLRQWNDRKKFIEQPLFPSYVFVYLNDLNAYYQGLHAQGVINYVRLGKEIAKVSENIIRSIRIALNHDNKVQVSTGQFSKGDDIIITEGPMAGLAGEVIQHAGSRKILVRLNLIQRNILVTVQSDSLMPSSMCYYNNSVQVVSR